MTILLPFPRGPLAGAPPRAAAAPPDAYGIVILPAGAMPPEPVESRPLPLRVLLALRRAADGRAG